MPYGPGTYGKQVGRPSNTQKVSGKSALKDVITKRESTKNLLPIKTQKT